MEYVTQAVMSWIVITIKVIAILIHYPIPPTAQNNAAGSKSETVSAIKAVWFKIASTIKVTAMK